MNPNTPARMANTQDNSSDMQKTAFQKWDTGANIGVRSRPAKRGFFSPLVLAGIGIVALFGIGILGLGGAYMGGLIGGRVANGNVNSIRPTPTPGVQVPTIRADLIQIPGGTFKMGRGSGGGDVEKPEHEVSVDGFAMDKTEVTNAAFYEFMAAGTYKPSSEEAFLVHWENKKPIPGDENKPVRYVNIEDVKAFAEWRSKRDGATYRLPTEMEWEYAARNGSKGDLYPWGDKFDPRCAHINEQNASTAVAGTKTCPNQWGVQDLIGNVFEWTGSEAWVYPGSSFAVEKTDEVNYMIRGGGAIEKTTGQFAITSTFRINTPASKRNSGLGFRLVRVGN